MMSKDMLWLMLHSKIVDNKAERALDFFVNYQSTYITSLTTVIENQKLI